MLSATISRLYAKDYISQKLFYRKQLNDKTLHRYKVITLYKMLQWLNNSNQALKDLTSEFYNFAKSLISRRLNPCRKHNIKRFNATIPLLLFHKSMLQLNLHQYVNDILWTAPL